MGICSKKIIGNNNLKLCKYSFFNNFSDALAGYIIKGKKQVK